MIAKGSIDKGLELIGDIKMTDKIQNSTEPSAGKEETGREKALGLIGKILAEPAQENVVETKALAASAPTAEEIECITKYRERSKRKPVKYVVDKESGEIKTTETVREVHLAKWMETYGTVSMELSALLDKQAFETFVHPEDETKGDIAVIKSACTALLAGINPQDEIEGMLAVQMVGAHNFAMKAFRGLGANEQPRVWVEYYLNQATKMTRTFIAQMEALKKYRTGGQQKMTVEHVHVNDGGQAIVGTVNQGGGGNNDKKSK